MSEHNCPVCKSSDSLYYVYSLDSLYGGEDKPSYIARCSNCHRKIIVYITIDDIKLIAMKN